MSNKKNSQKQTESVIVALIMILILLLAVVTGVVIYKNNKPHATGFGGGSGGGTLPPPTFATENIAPTQTPSDEINEENIVETSIEDEPEEEQPVKNEQPSSLDEKWAKKDEFLNKADDIEWYSQNYLETAETQSEINNESSIVYKKWDALLNEVYQYLKTIMSETEFKELQESEWEWVEEKENAIEIAGAEWEGGSGETMARNMTVIRYTEERCYYLISLIN